MGDNHVCNGTNNVLIIGDSYSTFYGYIPAGYAYYYGGERRETDITIVEETWWHQLIKETNYNLILNNSWSGSTICHTGYNNSDCSETSSFICRLEKLISNRFFEKNKIDTVFVFGGTNDNWAGAPVGDLKYSDWEKDDLYYVLPATCYFANRLKETLPKANIVFIINSDLKPEISNGIEKACEYYNLQSVRLKDIDKSAGHPTVKGMEQIKNQVLNNINL